jgi:hypothetical protein
MSPLLDSAAVRAGVFFVAGFAVATALGALAGDLRLGVTTGVAVGLVMAVFGAAFVRPADGGE